MIPRFDYSFTLREVWLAGSGVLSGDSPKLTEFAALFGNSSVYRVAKARIGLRFALQALSLGPNASVGVQPYTCSSVLTAITAAGCQPVFIDINQELTLNESDLANKVGRLKALIVTHPFGTPANMDRIKQVAGHLPIIEDCAHAFLSTYKQKALGSFFDMAVFSFGYGKFPVLGNGGLIVVNNPVYKQAIADQIARQVVPGPWAELRFISQRYLYSLLYSRAGYGFINRFFAKKRSQRNQTIELYPSQEIAPFRTAWYRLGLPLTIYQQQVERQQRHTRRLVEQLGEDFDVVDYTRQGSNGFALVILTENRDQLYNYLIRKGIGVGKHFEYAQVWATESAYQLGSCPVFEQLVSKVLTIPCHHRLKEADLQRIIKAFQGLKSNT